MSAPINVASRENMTAQLATGPARAAAEGRKAFLDTLDTEEVAPSAGLTIRTLQFDSTPDGNATSINFIRPDSPDELPCVFYIHGGAMQMGSCYDGVYRAWGRMIAARGVAVATVDFRNRPLPSSASEVAHSPQRSTIVFRLSNGCTALMLRSYQREPNHCCGGQWRRQSGPCHRDEAQA